MTRQDGSVDPRFGRTREALLAAAVELVEAKDVSEISITDIASAAGVSRQAIYSHFSDRDEILADAAILRLSRAITEAEVGATRLPKDGSAPETLVALISHLMDHPTYYRRIFTGSTSADAFIELSQRNRHHFERLMELPARPGWSGPAGELAEQDLIEFLAGGSAALTVSWIIDPPADPPRTLANRLWDLWMTLRPTSIGEAESEA